MNIEDIKAYLEKELPEFEYKTSDLEVNENKLWIEREGQHMVFDISKIAREKDLKSLKAFIELKWRQVQ